MEAADTEMDDPGPHTCAVVRRHRDTFGDIRQTVGTQWDSGLMGHVLVISPVSLVARLALRGLA
jgi:hypothetical protein